VTGTLICLRLQASMFQKLANYFGGRHTLAATWFALTGLVLAWFHRLDPSYVSLIVALQGYICLHSIKEDYYQNKQGPTIGGNN
jgi:hypothetical protein